LVKLRRLKIVVTRPNAEDLTDEYAEIMRKLNGQGARTITQELIKAPKIDRLNPDEETRKLAKIASTNGYVEGDVKDLHESTKEHPKAITVEVGKDGSSLSKFLSAFHHFL